MLLLGLTGSIATGKSTVSNLLRAPPYNLPIIDADVLAREVVEPGTPGYQKLVDHFGPTTPDLLLPPSDPLCGGKELGKNGKGRPLNRPALGLKVFGESEEALKNKKALNGIVHPAVGKAIYKAMLFHFIKGHWAVVLDVPLLFESGWERYCGTVMVVAVSDPEVQIKRLRERDSHLSEEAAKNRILSQRDIREKVKQAQARGEGRGVVVYNDSDREHLAKEVSRAMEQIQKASPVWWSTLCLICPPVGVTAAAWTIWQNWNLQKEWAETTRREKARL
ncbi:CoaE-domain-containing protein [Tothia fuscella]|uniref:CoaE-domain-containing protein n=1 Tax=Tothia fuscella TaxID=1048955 RepID=A0A9P4U5L5_9PEZI|nr:CoaE-domain-containing protein [Tothia fuscella]